MNEAGANHRGTEKMWSKPFRSIRLGQSYFTEAWICGACFTAAVLLIPVMMFGWESVVKAFGTLNKTHASGWMLLLVFALFILNLWTGLVGERPFFTNRRAYDNLNNPTPIYLFNLVAFGILIVVGGSTGLFMSSTHVSYEGRFSANWLLSPHVLSHLLPSLLIWWALLTWAYRLDSIKWNLYDAEPEPASAPGVAPQPWVDQEEGWHEGEGV